MKNLSSDYGMDVLLVYMEDSESYKEVIHDYVQSLFVNTHVKVTSNIKVKSEDLKKYDLIYPDISLVDADNKEEIADALTNYVRTGGNLFLEEDMYKIFPNDVFGMSEIVGVNLTNQTFDFPVVPRKFEIFQKLWKAYAIKKKKNALYNITRIIYHKVKGNYDTWVKSPMHYIYDIDLTKVDFKTGALPRTAISLVNSNGFSLLSVNKYGNGNVLWTINYIPKRGEYFGKPFMTRKDLSYPDPKAKNFHFGYATINYLMRNAYLDFIAKEKYGFSIQKVFGAYGRPSFSWQNHLEIIDAWKNNKMIRWINMLKKQNQIPTFSVIRIPFIDEEKEIMFFGARQADPNYAVNSPYLINEVRRNIGYALNHSICIIPHFYFGRNYSPEQERYELEMHKRAFNDLGITWKKTLGTNHHYWNVHAVPVWQTLYTEKDFGLLYDFGFETMGADFIELSCTSHPYMPYGIPFLLMKNAIEPYPFIFWTPNTIREYTTFDGKSGLFVFPSSFDLPITYYFHPEHAFKETKRDILLSYLFSLLNYGAIPTRLDLHSGEAYKVLRSFNKLRDEKEYNMMSEEQAAKAMLNMYYTRMKVKIDGNKLTLIPDTGDVPETAEEYKNTLGIKIEIHPDFESNGITTDNSIYYTPTDRQIYLGLYKETLVNLNERTEEFFHLVRSNVPFVLNSFSDKYEITVKSAGMRQFKIFSPYPLKLKVKNSDVRFEKKGNYYVVTDYGDSNRTIILTVDTT